MFLPAFVSVWFMCESESAPSFPGIGALFADLINSQATSPAPKPITRMTSFGHVKDLFPKKEAPDMGKARASFGFVGSIFARNSQKSTEEEVPKRQVKT